MVSHPFIRNHFHHMGRNDAKCSANSTTLTHDRVKSIRKQALQYTRTGSLPQEEVHSITLSFNTLSPAAHRVDPTAAGLVGVRGHCIQWSCGLLWILKWPGTFDAAVRMSRTPILSRFCDQGTSSARTAGLDSDYQLSSDPTLVGM